MTQIPPHDQEAADRLRRKNYAVLALILGIFVLFFIIGIIRMGSPLETDDEGNPTETRIERYQRFDHEDDRQIEWSDEDSAAYFEAIEDDAEAVSEMAKGAEDATDDVQDAIEDAADDMEDAMGEMMDALPEETAQ